MNRLFFVALIPLLSMPNWAAAQLSDMTVNFDLGVLPVGSSTALIGDTSTDPEGSEVQTYFGVGAIGGFLWGNEEVYQIELTQPSVLQSTRVSTAEDTHLIVLDGLERTTTLSGYTAASNGVAWFNHSANQVGSIVLDPGTYYLSATESQGFNSAYTPSTPAELGGAYNILIDILATPTAADIRSIALDLGAIVAEGEELSLTTFGSEITDTELAVYNAAGMLVAENDDAGAGFQSGIQFSDGLAKGEYFAAVGSFDSIFGTSYFSTSSGSNGGGVVLNYPGGQALSSVVAGTGEVAWYRFQVVPEPSSMALLGLAAVATLVSYRRSR